MCFCGTVLTCQLCSCCIVQRKVRAPRTKVPGNAWGDASPTESAAENKPLFIE